MNVAFARPSWWQRLAPIFQGFDLPFVGIIVFMCLLGLVNMYSVGFDHGTRFIEHGRNMMLGAMILFVVSQVPPQRLRRISMPEGKQCLVHAPLSARIAAPSSHHTVTATVEGG